MLSEARSQLLTEREREVMHLVSRGYANKRIAYDLGVRESTVATWLGRGLRKISSADRPRAVTLVVAARVDALDTTQFTDAERDVLTMLVEGASNADIARRRGRSVKTIANQVRAVYQKVGVGSRRELWAVCSVSSVNETLGGRTS